MVNKILIGLGTIALAVAAAASHMVKISDPLYVNGSMLKPGEYKVEVNQNTATFKNGKTVVEAPVTVEQGNEKYPTNSLRVDGQKLQELRFGGTHTRLLFEKSGS